MDNYKLKNIDYDISYKDMVKKVNEVVDEINELKEYLNKKND